MKLIKGISAAAALLCSTAVFAEDIEVLHYYTSGGESLAVNVLKEDLEAKGNKWIDSAIAGGGGANAMTVLKTRVISGDAPKAVQMRGPAIQDWAEQGALVDLEAVSQNWDEELPPAIADALKYDDKYYGVVNWVHRVNWMYINKPLLDEVGAQVPTTWDEFFVVADKLKAAGHIPIAHGGTPYHDAVYFEGIVQSQGVDFYRKAILEGDPEALNSPQMVEVFDILRKSTEYFDGATQGRPWNLAAAMVIEGKAGFLFMGDWAKGEFSAAGKVPDVDYICAVRPGNEGIFTFIADGFTFFGQRGSDGATPGQLEMASVISSPDFQERGAKFKGAIPAMKSASLDGFDSCSQKAAADLLATSESGGLVPSQNQGTTEAVLGAIRDVVTNFINSNQDSASAAAELANAVQAAK
ncbi:ABC transporter substrate-binding protein [Aureimonas fodinaquatilis]|nr:ABC transporter substrate-binding protein [Aureimonas fodinaquatilis]